jgi:hypothetical protein
MCFIMFAFTIITVLHFYLRIIKIKALAIICTRFRSKFEQISYSKHTGVCLVCKLICLFCLCLRQVLNRTHALQKMPANIFRV